MIAPFTLSKKRWFFSAFFILLLTALIPCHLLAQVSEATIQYSLYWENFKNGNFRDALPNLRWILANTPEFTGQQKLDDRNFERAVALFDTLASLEKDETISRAFHDTTLMLFDSAIPTLTARGVKVDTFKWTIEKGRFIQRHSHLFTQLQDSVAAIYRDAYELDPQRVDIYYLEFIIQDNIQREEKQGALDFMNELESTRGSEEAIVALITRYRNDLFKSPDERKTFLEAQLLKKPDDMKILRELFGLYRQTGPREKMYEMGAILLEKDPSPSRHRELALMRLEDGENRIALDLLQRVQKLPGYEPIPEDYFNMGITHSQLENWQEARALFRKALSINQNYGPALIAIGDLYVSAVSECVASKGGNFEREDRAVYWLATDYYSRARQVDPSMESRAESKASTYRRAFPDQEALFFKHWKVGDRYMINYGCYAWINEATTVKSP